MDAEKDLAEMSGVKTWKHHCDYFGIYQLKNNEQAYHFINLNFIRSGGIEVNEYNYKMIYRGELAGQSLDTIFEQFNYDHTRDLKRRDIVGTRKMM